VSAFNISGMTIIDKKTVTILSRVVLVDALKKQNHFISTNVSVSLYIVHKSDGCTSMTSGNIINAGDDCLMHLTQPDSFLYSTIVPIPKGRNVNRCDSSNYRGITLSSVYLKLIDNIVLQRFSANPFTSELQFGFKRKSSTSLYSFALKETLAYYSVLHFLRCY